MKVKEVLSQEEYRGDSYKLLSECYYLPDENLINMLKGLNKSRGELPAKLTRCIPGMSDIESLKVDYSKLFLGPYGLLAPPYGSVYLEDTRMVMGNSTMDARNKYGEEGLDISLKEAPDHIAIELEFMYFLILKQVETIRNQDYEATTSYLMKQKNFLNTHLGMWVSEFVDNVKTNAQTEFYKNLAVLTESFVREDIENLSRNSILAFLSLEPISNAS